MCSWNKSNVLEEVDSSDGSELEYKNVIKSFGGLQPYLFEPENQISVKTGLNNCKRQELYTSKKTQVA